VGTRFFGSCARALMSLVLFAALASAFQTVAAASTFAPTAQQVAYGRAECANDGGTFIGASVKFDEHRVPLEVQLVVRCGWPHSPKVVEQDISSIHWLTALPADAPVRVFAVERTIVTATHP
jgi:hypothetical protein